MAWDRVAGHKGALAAGVDAATLARRRGRRIETARGLVPAALRAAGYQVFPINPLAVSRYRDRYSVSRAKSDPGDAVVLANILRTDPAAHRPLPDDNESVQTIRVLARAQQDAVWDRQHTGNKLRSLLREYYPGVPGHLRRPVRPGRPGHPRPRSLVTKLSTPEMAALVDGYRAGATVHELADRFAIHRVTVSAHLHRHGVTMRRQRLDPDQVDQAVHLYAHGRSVDRIGTRLGVDAGTVRSALRARGVRLRDPQGRDR